MNTSVVMEKRVRLGVRRKKPIKRTKKSFLKKVVDYLKSDCYMFAPLISSPPFGLSVPKIACSAAATGVEYEKPMKEKRKRLAKEVWNYSKSDSYMYASLMVPQSSQVFLGTKIRSPCSGPLTSISMRGITKKSNQLTKQTENVTPENQPSKDRSSELGIASGQPVGHPERVKHMAHKTCRSLSKSGDKMTELHARKPIVK